DLSDRLIQGSRRGQVSAKRLLDDEARPAPGLRRREVSGTEILCDHTISVRGRCEVEEAVARRAVGVILFRQPLAQARIGVLLVEGPAHIVQTAGEAVP